MIFDSVLTMARTSFFMEAALPFAMTRIEIPKGPIGRPEELVMLAYNLTEAVQEFADWWAGFGAPRSNRGQAARATELGTSLTANLNSLRRLHAAPLSEGFRDSMGQIVQALRNAADVLEETEHAVSD
jgi:hypothetical protein